MLRTDRPLSLPELPELLVFADGQDPQTFYAVPARPRLARDAEGRPELSLTFFGRERGGSLAIEGALIQLTVDLALTSEERHRLEALLAQRTGDRLPRLLAPPARTGEVEARLVPGVTLHGRPALYGDNRCALQQRVGAELARELERAWEQGFPQGEIRYVLELEPSSGRMRVEESQAAEVRRKGDAAAFRLRQDVRRESEPPRRSTLRLAGPLGAGPRPGRLARLPLGGRPL